MKNKSYSCSCCKDSGHVNCNLCFGQRNIWVGVSAGCDTGWRQCSKCDGTGQIDCPEHCAATKTPNLRSNLEVIRNHTSGVVAPANDIEHVAVLWEE